MTLQTHCGFFLAIVISAALMGCSDSDNSAGGTSGGTDADQSCSAEAAQALQSCISASSAAKGSCYFEGNGPCEENNADLLAAQNTLQNAIFNSCVDNDLLGLSVNAAEERFQNACQSQSDSVAWRTFGGPQGAVWPAATSEQKRCLQSAFETVSEFVNTSLLVTNRCLADASCDLATVAVERQQSAVAAIDAVTEACPALSDMIAVDPQTYITRAAEQVDCIIATAHKPDTALNLTCGPANVDTLPPRGEWTQIVLDGQKWGTLCGDGSEYAIQVRLAPEGSPLDKVLIGLQGGGVCLFEEDCRASLQSNPGLFNAMDDSTDGAAGLFGNVPDNPFANWTQVYLPYCNRDVFIGGGVVESFGDFDLPRYGAINLRAGVRVVRDMLWKLLDDAGGAGFRPDELVALVGGFSAGAYGILYNYHWFLDDLLWPRTAAYPDAGGAYDNGSLAGVRNLGFLKLPEWGPRNFLPPYCFSGDCAVSTDNFAAISPRLKQVPEQQYLILSNQKDNTQQADAFFTDEAQWIDTMRSAYCDTKDLPGIQWYLTSDSINSVHVVSIRDEFFYGDVAGERMVDWFERAATDPESVGDWAEEGNFTTDIPGSSPFPCALP